MHRKFLRIIPTLSIRLPQPSISKLHSQLNNNNFQIHNQHFKLLYPKIGKTHNFSLHKKNISKSLQHNVLEIIGLSNFR
jgi:hypothetical protein